MPYATNVTQRYSSHYRWKLPQSDADFEKTFPTEEACKQRLFEMRWLKGFVCPSCKTEKNFTESTRDRLVCCHCQYRTTVAAGTMFAKSHMPLKLWFKAIWLLTSRESISSVTSLQQKLGLNYSTAWDWFHKLRKKMMPSNAPLGIAEIGITYLEHEKDAIGQRTKQTLIAVAADRDSKKRGVFHIKRIQDASRETLREFITETVSPGGIIYTNKLKSADGLPGYVYRSPVRLQDRWGEPLRTYVQYVQEVGELLRKWLSDTHPGAVDSEYLDYYLGEFAFRFGHTSARSHGKLFTDLLWRAVPRSAQHFPQRRKRVAEKVTATK